MARPFVFPDPNDRSPNNPSIILSNEQVLGIYNQDCADGEMQRVTEKVKEWFVNEGKSYNWDEIEFIGNQCILSVKLDLRPVPNK